MLSESWAYMTTDVTQARIRKVLAGVLAPLARTLLRCGVSYTEFAELSKRAFVDAASKDYGVRNRPTNIARVAVMTGLSRKEVSRIRMDRTPASRQVLPHGTLPGAVLNSWHTNPAFLDRAGEPRALSFAGAKNSFSTLVHSVSRDIPPGAIRRELIRAGAIRATSAGKFIPIKRYFVPDSASDRVIIGLELGLTRLAETIAFNSNPTHAAATRFQRFVEGPISRPADLKIAREALQAMLAKFSGNVDDYLSSMDRSQGPGRNKRKAIQAGIGLYYYEDESAN